MTSAVIVAAGRGTRMGPGVDKLFLPLKGVPVVVHCWRCFDASPDINDIILVVRDGWQESFDELARNHHFQRPYRLVVGGAERQDSVANGIAALANDSEWVAIHDGARPLLSQVALARCLMAARQHGVAVAAQRAVDTIKEASPDGTIARHLDRNLLWTVQTPQCFHVPIIRKAMAAVKAAGKQVTDDTAACEFIGQSVRLVECPEPNLKVTAPGDLPLLESLLA
jgi:2-C-methyl-D-erythritol 4-phosphate cytidylyltransferase